MDSITFALTIVAAAWLAFSLGFLVGAYWRSMFDQ
jgi:hypothetical protein